MARLTKAEKEAIVNRAVKDVFDKKFQKLPAVTSKEVVSLMKMLSEED